MNIALFVEGDFVPAYSGAADRQYNLAKHLHGTGKVNVIVVMVDRGWSDLEILNSEQFHTILLHPNDYYNNISLLYDLLSPYSIDLLQFCNSESCFHIGVNLALKLGSRLIYEAHYNPVEFAAEQGASYKQIESIQRLQQHLALYLDGIVCLSADDIQLVRNDYGRISERITCVSSGIEISQYLHPIANQRSNNIVFLGNMYFEPNSQAVHNIHSQIYPQLKRQFEFVIIGDCPKVLTKKYNDDNFTFVGNLESLISYSDNILCGLAPVGQGAGQRIKLLHYSSAGIPIICTAAAARGFPYKSHLIICDNLENYSELILDLTISSSYARYSTKMHEMVRTNLSWEQQCRKLLSFYYTIIDSHYVRKSDVPKYPVGYHPLWLSELLHKGRFIDKQPSTRMGVPRML